MRLLWMINAPLGNACKVFDMPASQSGTWVDSTADLLKDQDIDLAIATTADILKPIKKFENNIHYYCIAGGRARRGLRSPKRNIRKWKAVIDDFAPDIIQLWGSEFSDGLDVMDAAGSIPCVLYTQGVISAISKYPLGRLSFSELTSGIPIHKKVISFKYLHDAKKLKDHIKYEEEITRRVKGVITDNHWCAHFFKSIESGVKVFFHNLPMNTAFRDGTWDMEKCERYTIFCNAGRTPYKGIHEAIRALSIVKKDFPNVKLRIPGAINFSSLSSIKTPPYFSYLFNLAKELGVIENIEFTGTLSSAEMAGEMKKAHVFIMPSAIENLSTTLREAMLVGVPSVSSSVGCVPEYLHHEQNGLLYRYGEYEQLAYGVMQIFNDDLKAKNFSSASRKTINEKYFDVAAGADLKSIYQAVLLGKNDDRERS